MDNGGEWCTYVQAAKRLHKSHGAIRQMALRGQLQRVRGNDGKALVLISPDMERAAHERAEHTEHAGDGRPARALPVQAERAMHGQHTNSALVQALERHIKTLQDENEELRERGEKQAADFAEREARHDADLAAERQRADKAIAAAEARAAQEAEKAGKAIEAFAALAERLDELAAARRPWWRRLVG